MMRRSSLVVHGRNDGNDDAAWATTDGGGTSAVAARMSSILREKNAAKPLAEWPVALATSRFRPSSVDKERHSRDDERLQRVWRASQYCSYVHFFDKIVIFPSLAKCEMLMHYRNEWLLVDQFAKATLPWRFKVHSLRYFFVTCNVEYFIASNSIELKRLFCLLHYKISWFCQ